MGHDHHHGEDRSAYYIEQLCTIGICGAFGGVAITMYARNTLKLFLDPKFHPFVLWAGIAVLVMVVLRAVAVWRAVGESSAAHDHAHDHEHGADCHHDHGCSHDHEHAHTHEHSPEQAHAHDHDHGWNPWRYAVLLLPIVLFFLNLPNKGFSEDWMRSRSLNPDQIQTTVVHYSSELGIQLTKASAGDPAKVERVGEGSPAAAAGVRPGDVIVQITREADDEGHPLPKPDVAATQGLSLDAALAKLQGPAGTKVKLTLERDGAEKQDVELVREENVLDLGFKELDAASLTAKQREFYSGRKARVKGQFSPSNKTDRGFTLMRLKMTCCAADVIPLPAWIEAPASVSQFKPQEWVEVEGQIRFDQTPSKYVPVLKVQSMDKIRRIPPEPDEFVR